MPRSTAPYAALCVALLAARLPAQPAAARVAPVLAFPEPGVDDSAVYRGYQTRFFRDAARNTVQIYLDRREGRVVHLWADAEDESLGFSARGADGQPLALRWASADAAVATTGKRRTLSYALAADAPRVDVGWFVLGSMRVERDFQYSGGHRKPYGGAPYVVGEIDRLLATLDGLEPAVRRRHLALLGASDVATLRARLRPVVTTRRSAAGWTVHVVQPSLDARDTLTLDLLADARAVTVVRVGDAVSLRARDGKVVPFTVRIASAAPVLTPLARDEIFTPQFLGFLASSRAAGGEGATTAAGRDAHWMERQVRGVELLVSHEKLMAGLPAYATYFGRDMLVSALMMRSIWRDDMSAFAVGAALRKLSPDGEVSHEEALGGQAVREAASEYAALVAQRAAAVRAGNRVVADSLLARAESVLRDRHRVRENYHMIDDELQLPVLAARWLADDAVPAARKRAFLLDSSDGTGPRATRLLRELALVARMTAPYVADPVATNLVPFARRDSTQWASQSWRDSGVGYANGRFAMDVNAIWAPHALESLGRILRALDALGMRADSLAAAMPELAAGTPIGRYLRDPSALRAAIDRWRGAERHFVVRLAPAEVRTRVAARLAAMPAAERQYWTARVAASGAGRDSITFLALSLDADGHPIGVANTDPATRLFLGDTEDSVTAGAAARDAVLRDVRLFVREYPVGLLVDGVGPAVANDAYATPPVWQAFDHDRYHGPKVVWGREVNLFLLGTANRIAAGGDPAYVAELRAAVDRVRGAVTASGFHSELWSYDVVGGRVVPMRYGSGSDVQLWSTTDLAVRYALSRLGR